MKIEKVGEVLLAADGLTKRDHLAIGALLVVAGAQIHMEDIDRRRIAREAYAMADAMIEASEITPGQLQNLVRR